MQSEFGRRLSAADAERFLGISGSTVRTWHQRREHTGLYPIGYDRNGAPLFWEADLIVLIRKLTLRDAEGERQYTMEDLTAADLVDPFDPAFKFIVRAAKTLIEFGYDPKDPDVARRAIVVGRARYKVSQERNAAKSQKSKEAHAEIVNLDAPELVYYMRIGDRVKIGWTTNLPERISSINPEEFMTAEPGTRLKEKERHQQFASLHSHGEWFRLEQPLVGHIKKLQKKNSGYYLKSPISYETLKE